jgi:hypothetical protein
VTVLTATCTVPDPDGTTAGLDGLPRADDALLGLAEHVSSALAGVLKN